MIAARQGGVIPLWRIAGDTIPASGPARIVSQSVLLQNNQGPGPVTGKLAGVAGTIVRNEDGTFDFTRTQPGDAVSISTAEPFIVDTFGRRSWSSIFWYGRNNYWERQQVLDDVAASVAFLEPCTKFVVLSVLNGAGEIPGTWSYIRIKELNDALAAAYPDNFLDVRSYLVSRYDATIPADVTDHANDVVPTSIRFDAIHLNPAGRAMLAQRMKQFLEDNGW